jgi:hypothetical protein
MLHLGFQGEFHPIIPTFSRPSQYFTLPHRSMCMPCRLCGIQWSPNQSVQTPHDLGCPCGLCTKIALTEDWTRLSTAEPIAAARCTLYCCTIVAWYTLLTCAICITCGLIRNIFTFIQYGRYDICAGLVISWPTFPLPSSHFLPPIQLL